MLAANILWIAASTLGATETPAQELARGERLAGEGKVAEALQATASACSRMREELGAGHASVASCVTKQSIRAREAGRYEEAQSLAGQAGETLERIAGPRSVDALAARQAQAQALWFLRRWDESRELAARVAADRAQVLGPRHADTLASRNTLAASLRPLGRNAEALAAYREILDILEADRDPTDPEVLRVKNNLAIAMIADDRPGEAAFALEQVVAAQRERSGPRHPQTLIASANLANALLLSGDAPRALRVAESALPDFLGVLGDSHPESLRLQVYLVRIYFRTGRYEEASRLAAVLVPKFEKSLGPRHTDTLQSRINAATARLYASGSEEALAQLKEATDALAAALGKTSPAALVARSFLGFSCLRVGRFADARDVFERDLGAGSLPERSAGPVALSLLVNHAGSAQAQFELGNRAQALARLEDVLVRKREQFGADHPGTLDTLDTLAIFRARSGDADGAIALLEELVRLNEGRVVVGLSTSDARTAYLAFRIGEDFQKAGYATLAALLAGRDPQRAFEIAELTKARALNDALGIEPRLERLDPAGRARARALSARLAAAETAMLRAAPGSPAQLERQAERAGLKADIAALLPPGGEARAQVHARIAPGSVYVSYLFSGNRLFAFVIDHRGKVEAHDLAEIPGLPQTVDAWRRLVASDDPRAERVWRLPDGRYAASLARPGPEAEREVLAARVGAEVSRRVLAPLERSIGSARRLIVSVDGALAFAPFDLLALRGRRLVETVDVTYVPSIMTLSTLRQRRQDFASDARRQGFLGIAIASHAGAGKWGNLPNAEEEVKAIAAAFGSNRSRTLLGAAATKSALADLDRVGALENFRFVHLATHAHFSQQDPKLSAIVLDEEITAAEWPALRMRADVIVLSACETGLGRLETAQGLVGLPYAMMASGALSSVLTLWRVSDEGAGMFMSAFYRRMNAGRSPSQALRETKLEFANSKGPWSAPRHWAPYVLYGD